MRSPYLLGTKSKDKESVTPQMYIKLRQSVGMASTNVTVNPLAIKVAEASIKNCWHSCYISHTSLPGEIVAMGRVIGDGGCSFRIEDVATHKGHRRKKLGTVVMQNLLKHIDEKSAAKWGSSTTLDVTPEGRKLYDRLRFTYPYHPVTRSDPRLLRTNMPLWSVRETPVSSSGTWFLTMRKQLYSKINIVVICS